MTLQLIVMLVGALAVCFGLFRLLWLNVDDVNNVSLTQWLFTGGFPRILGGFVMGIGALISRRPDSNSKAAVIVIAGVLIMLAAW